MPSLRLRLANVFSRRILRPRLARTRTPAEARADLERGTRFALRPWGMVLRDEGEVVRISVGEPDPDRVILYFHGGGYVVGSPLTHRALAGRIAGLTGLEVVLPRYPLAPEHPAPAAYDAAFAAFEALVARGYAPGSIVLGGDSAGGGLALALLSRLCGKDQRPAGLFSFSAWTDLTASGASIAANADRDHLFEPGRLPELVGYVTAGGIAPEDPRISPLFAAFDRPPPVLMQVACSEILYDDSRRMAERLQQAGSQVTLSELEAAPHVWQLMDGLVPEARDSLKEVAGFIQTCFSDPQAPST